MDRQMNEVDRGPVANGCSLKSTLAKLFAATLCALPLACAAPAAAQDDGATPQEDLTAGFPTDQDGPSYSVGGLTLQYLRENPLHPALAEMMQTAVELGQTSSGYIMPREGVPTVTYTLAEISARPVEDYFASAVQHILETLRDAYVERDLLGVYVAPDPQQIDPATGADLRAAGETDLLIIVTTGIVTELRTVGAGERVGEKRDIKPEERINHPLHAPIRERSPVKPFVEGDEERMDLVRKSELDRYLFHLSRHPGRRVDASVAAAQEIGGLALDYMVTENRPLVFYAQISNTGTKSTDTLRERFGFFHTQLTNSDDILSLDYSTANFDEVNAVVAAYERPFADDRIRWRVQGGYSEYDASELGVFRNEFTGQDWFVGGEIAWNFFQDRELFLDVVGGARYEDIKVRNELFRMEGNQDFVFPYLGVRLDRRTGWYDTTGALLMEFQFGSVTDVDSRELTRLGRTDPDDDWAVLKWNLSHSVYLEPLLNREAWEDPSTPESSTLAHELFLHFRGQWAFDYRLIPQAQQVMGGLYTVRGYPQSVIAGDTALLGTVEYRYHLPRALDLQTEPGELFGETFRAAPQYVYGTPDWDLILKGFFDIGRTVVSDPFSFENDETLIGAGVGLELLYRRNLNVRLDWGFVLEELEDRDVNSGSNRLHVVATILF